jgi:hypothetical protein
MPLASFKQTNGYFVAVAPILSSVQFAVSVASSGSGGDWKVASVSNASAVSNQTTITTGTMLKDMGKTIVSSSHVYRKVQAVVTNGAAVVSPPTTNAAGLPFYIELATGNQAQAAAAPVAYLPGLFL